MSAAAAAKSLQSVRPHRRQPTRLPYPWDSPGKNTGVGCHCLLQCMKVKSESEAAQSRPTLSDPMDCSLPGSSVHGIFQARVLEWGAIAFFDKCVYPEAILNLKNCFTPNWSFDFLFWNSDRITRSCRRKKLQGKSAVPRAQPLLGVKSMVQHQVFQWFRLSFHCGWSWWGH